jgi:cytochrome c oxidase cbb3-type subunit III
MSDFTSGFWSLFVAGVTVVSIVACALLLQSLSRRKVASDPDKTGHVWDEDLDEYNNPLPRWWIGLFWITIVFSVGYLWVYPGLGTYEGSFKWTSTGEYTQEVKVAEDKYGPLYTRFAATDLKRLAADPEARMVGQKLFVTYCSQCHASDARGGRGFPNLTDNDWLYGGEPETIKASIMEGRAGAMPAMGKAIGEANVKDVANFVRSLSGLAHDAAAAERGKPIFMVSCAACHGLDAKGNKAIGSANLTDNVWLHGSSEAIIMETITNGRTDVMPAHKEFLGEARSHILAAYVYGLSDDGTKGVIKVKTTK